MSEQGAVEVAEVRGGDGVGGALVNVDHGGGECLRAEEGEEVRSSGVDLKEHGDGGCLWFFRLLAVAPNLLGSGGGGQL